MAEVRDRAAWNRTFAVLAQLFNANRDPEKTRPIDPMVFFPWGKQTEEQAPAPTDEERQMLRRAFPKKRG
jgi:hypothetical protein